MLDTFRAPGRVTFSPPEITLRHVATWNGVHAETVQVIRKEPFDYRFRGDQHLLIAAERAERFDGETSVQGLPTSSIKIFNQKLTFVPAGHEFHGWQRPRALTRVTYLYLDPRSPLFAADERLSGIEFMPRMFFFDADLWQTAMKLRGQVESGAPDPAYTEALSAVLVHELARLNQGHSNPEPILHGGLSAWQKNRVAAYIEEHLAENISLAALATLAGLSSYHFSRAFRQSFGMPPHRYHLAKRIERAKCMLANMSLSVTEIGAHLGFSETSAFTSTFRRIAGRSPSEFRRSLR